MQDLASESSKKIFFWGGVIPQTLTAGGATPSRTQHPARPLAGRGVRTQTLVPLNFSAVVAPPDLDMSHETVAYIGLFSRTSYNESWTRSCNTFSTLIPLTPPSRCLKV